MEKAIYENCGVLQEFRVPKKFSFETFTMPRPLCAHCQESPAQIKRPRNGMLVCKECFYILFEKEIHDFIIKTKMFRRGEIVACGASGGKDSTVLAYVLSKLNKQYDYGIVIKLVSVDEGITGYRDDSLKTVYQNQIDYGLELHVVSYKQLYGWTMDEIVKEIGRKNNCTFCGVFRRQALERGSNAVNADVIATGHNADDVAETVLMNILRGDIARLKRTIFPRTPESISMGSSLPRAKPLMEAYEKEIVLYAHHKRLLYFSTECIYSPNAYRGYAREFLKDLERIRPKTILDIIQSCEKTQFSSKKLTKSSQSSSVPVHPCPKCGFSTSQKFCKACVLLHGLNSGRAKIAVGRPSKQLSNELAHAQKQSLSTSSSNPTSSLVPIQVVNTHTNDPPTS